MTTSRAAAPGRPSLGPRTVVTAALWSELEHVVDNARGSLDRSPFLADLLASHVGRTDLVRHRQVAMALPADGVVATAARPGSGTQPRTVRVHPDVAAELNTRATRAGLSRAAYNASAIAELLGAAGGHPLPTTEGGLPLAI